MAFEANSGLQVVNHYGARDTGGSVGVERTTKSLNTFSVELTGQSLTEPFFPPFVMPKHAKITRAWFTVDQPFAGLTSVAIGDGEAPATNGIVLALADMNTDGARDVTSKLTGRWAATVGVFTLRAARVGIVVTGTPTANVGRGTLSIEYVYKVRDDTEWQPDPASFPDYPAQA